MAAEGDADKPTNIRSYIERREKFLANESAKRIGHDVTLNDAEEKVNEVLMKHKRAEYNVSALSGDFLPAVHFMSAKKDIDKSPVYKIIKKMPKGGALHVHDVSIVNVDWLIANATYRGNCYVGVKTSGDQIMFQFSEKPPQTEDFVWNLAADLRKKAESPAKFDDWLKSYITMTVPNPPETVDRNQNKIWAKFLDALSTVMGLVFYEGVFPDYFYEAMRQASVDNVQYMEIRALLDQVYALDGTVRSAQVALDLYRKANDKFLKDHPDSSGFKIIQEDIRFESKKKILDSVKDAMVLHRDHPDFHLGFDLVAQEDLGHTLLYYYDELDYPAKEGVKLPFYFHAGETDWQGTPVDANLVDAVLLETRRIGHGYAIPKHPDVMAAVKEKQIAVEVNPISNQVLGLVSDLRNHAMAPLIARDFPIVISSDDPAVWGADILSHDFYAAFMALAGMDADLRLLKQLAVNSIKFSGMNQTEKAAAMTLWQKKWDAFIRDFTQP